MLLGWGAAVGIVKFVYRKDKAKAEGLTPLVSVLGAALGLALGGVMPWARFSRTVVTIVAFILFIPCAFGLFNLGSWASKMLPPRGKPNFVFALVFSVIFSGIILWFLIGYALGYSEMTTMKNWVYYPLMGVALIAFFTIMTALSNVGYSKLKGQSPWKWASKVVNPELPETAPPEGTPEEVAGPPAPAPAPPATPPTPPASDPALAALGGMTL